MDPDLEAQMNRITAAEALEQVRTFNCRCNLLQGKSLADKGSLEMARNVLSNAIAKIKASKTGSTPYCLRFGNKISI